MKKIGLLAIALCGLFAIQASAQDQAKCDKCPNGQKVMPGQMNKMYQPREYTEFAFEGILLDIDQQARIDSLNAAVKANAATCDKPVCTPGEQACDKANCDKANCDKAKCDKAKCDKAKCDKAKCDKAKCDKAKCDKGKCEKGDKAKCDKKQARPATPYGEEYRAKVKEILTPEQYVVFMENIVNMPQHNGKASMGRRHQGGNPAMRPGTPVQKGDRKAAKRSK